MWMAQMDDEPWGRPMSSSGRLSADMLMMMSGIMSIKPQCNKTVSFLALLESLKGAGGGSHCLNTAIESASPYLFN